MQRMDTTSKKQVIEFSVNHLKWDTRQRLAMIEATLLWEGRITSGILMELFGISRGQASKDFSLYHHLAEGNMIYDLNQKAYFPGESFMPYFIKGTADEYLRLFNGDIRTRTVQHYCHSDGCCRSADGLADTAGSS